MAILGLLPPEADPAAAEVEAVSEETAPGDPGERVVAEDTDPSGSGSAAATAA